MQSIYVITITFNNLDVINTGIFKIKGDLLSEGVFI